MYIYIIFYSIVSAIFNLIELMLNLKEVIIVSIILINLNYNLFGGNQLV